MARVKNQKDWEAESHGFVYLFEKRDGGLLQE
jgi:hypothetical protein